jgi:hypothetical protein
VAAVLSMHYFEYRDFPRALEPRLRDVVKAQVLRELLADPKEGARALEQKAAQLPQEQRKELDQTADGYTADSRRLKAQWLVQMPLG